MTINPFDILKNAQKLQESVGAMQEKLSEIQITGSSGGGMVEIDMNGKMEMLAVRISPDIMAEGDADMLGDLFQAAYSSAQEKCKEAIQQELGSMAGAYGIPGLGAGMGV
jgi:DNA-binding YbaB/EbfC family protein